MSDQTQDQEVRESALDRAADWPNSEYGLAYREPRKYRGRHVYTMAFIVGLGWGAARVFWGGSWNWLMVAVAGGILLYFYRARSTTRSQYHARLFVGLMVTTTIVAWAFSWSVGRYVISRDEIHSDPIMFYTAAAYWYDHFEYLPGDSTLSNNQPPLKANGLNQPEAADLWIIDYTHKATHSQKREILRWYIRQPGTQPARTIRANQIPRFYEFLWLAAICWLIHRYLDVKKLDHNDSASDEEVINWIED